MLETILCVIIGNLVTEMYMIVGESIFKGNKKH